MNGKYVVGGLGVIAILTLMLGLYFNTGATTPDQRFSRRRIGLPDEVMGPRLLSPDVANYARKSFTPIEADPATGLVRGSAVYQELDYGKDVHFEIFRVAENARAELRKLYEASPAAGDAAEKKYLTDSGLDYAYVVTDLPGGGKRYEFMWTNNKWILRAWTNQADADALLRFVNSYRF